MDKFLEQMINEIYADAKVSPSEVIKLNKFAEETIDKLISFEGGDGVSSAMCRSFQVTNQLVQSTLLKMRKNKETEERKKIFKKVIEAQIELLKANMELFS